MAVGFDPRIRLRHLTAFLETIRQGGVARAGAELGMTQPAVSKAIAELESITGVALFDRSRRALTLTAEGEVFARFAQAGIATIGQGIDTLRSTRDGVSSVAFGALPSVTADVVPRALMAFARAPLACRTLVESGPSPYLLGLLRRGAIDFVVGRLARPEAMEGLSFEQLCSERLVLVVRPSHPLAAEVRVSLQQAAGYAWLMPPRDAIIRPAIDALLIAGGVSRLAQEFETVSNSLGRALTLQSDSVWAISESVVRADLATGQLVRLAADMAATLGPIGITTRTAAELTAPTLELIAAIRAAGRSEAGMTTLNSDR